VRTFAVTLLAAIASAKTLDQNDFDFVNYIAKHGKSYTDLNEYNLRFERFRAMDQAIKHFTETETSSQHGHNFLSDYTHEEYSKMLGLKNIARDNTTDKGHNFFTSQATAPESVDWRSVTPAVVNPVKDQGQCGSCWAFSAVASMESAHAIFNGTLLSLSEQNLVSCSFLQGNLGCNGGMYARAWNYSNGHPLELESAYPYTSGTTMKSGSCTYNSSLGQIKATSHTSVGTDNTSIMNAIAQQPVSIAVDAETAYFQSYTSGVLTNAAACGTTMDHAIQAVGYGQDPTYGGYYIVRNSWSASWGDQGYVNIGMAPAPGICGMNQDIMFPTTN
jgi:C1A family cysteine protease